MDGWMAGWLDDWMNVHKNRQSKDPHVQDVKELSAQYRTFQMYLKYNKHNSI